MKSKAHPREYNGDGPVSISVAYDELSRRAFAVWIRLMVEPPDVLLIGRGRLARLVGYSERRFSEVLQELERKGYVGLIRPERIGFVTQLIIRRRAAVNARQGNWVRLGNVLQPISKFMQTETQSLEDSCVKDHASAASNADVDQCSLHVCPSKNSVCDDGGDNPDPWVQLNFGSVCINFGNPAFIGDVVLVNSNSYCNSGSGKTSGQNHTSSMVCLSATMLNGVKKRHFAKDPNEPNKTSGLSIDRLRRAKEGEKKRRIETTRAKRGLAKQRRGKGVDWAKLDLLGDPVVSFEPGDRERRRVLEVLSRRARDPDRVQLVAKLEREFCRIYTRYRRQAERDLTGSTNYNEVWEQERKLAARAAVLCIQKGITPTRLIHYWHKAIRGFTDLKIPTLRFLSSPANVDRAACSEIKDTKEKPPAGNSFSAVYGLDVRLRPALERAGFDTRPYNDRFMLGIQHNAMAIAQGKDIFMAKGRVRDMAMFAAEHLFNEE